jgi:hypothetical protein
MYVLVLLSAPTMVKPQSIHRAIPIIINQSSDSKENNEKKGPVSDTNNSYSDKLREVKKLREKRIEGVRDRLEGLGLQWNPHSVLRYDYETGFYTLVYCISPKP